MKRTVAIAFAAALLVHALLLFGFRAGDVARPLPLSDLPQTVDVTLVEASSEPPSLETSPPAPEATPNTAPEPTPEPLTPAEPPPPQPEPEPSAPQPLPSPTPNPTATPKPAPPRPAHPANASHTPAPRPEPSAAPAPSNHSLSQWLHCWDSGSGTPSQSARPRYRSNPPPRYPAESRRNGEQGVVVISAQVGADGRPNSVTLKQSSGSPLLDAAALEAVRQWTFNPAHAGSLPSASRVDVPVRFALETR